jgi:hypothetical protein
LELGWVLYLLGDYPASVEASRAAEVLDPGLTPIVMNIATALLAQGDTAAAMQEYERGLAIAADPAPHSGFLESRLSAGNGGRSGTAHRCGGRADRVFPGTASGQRGRPRPTPRRRRGGASAHQRRHCRHRGQRRSHDAAAEAALLPLRFGQYASYDGKLLGVGDTFARGLMSMVIELPFDVLPQGATLSRRVTREWSDEPGELEQLPTMAMDMVWEGESAGMLQTSSRRPGRGAGDAARRLYGGILRQRAAAPKRAVHHPGGRHIHRRRVGVRHRLQQRR